MTLPPIVCGVDDRYAQPLGALLRSVAAAHGDRVCELRLVVIHDRLSHANRRWIGRLAARLGIAVDLCAVPRVDQRYPVSRWISEAVYLRLAIPEVLVNEPVALYLDADVLVMRDLRPLLRHRLQGAALAAVRDPHSPLVGVGLGQPGWRELGLPEGREYFNSGVMLLDLEQCRRRAVFARAHQFLREHPDRAQLWDQDALNWAVNDGWLRLDRRWNTFAVSALGQRAEAHHRAAEPVVALSRLVADEQTAAILHFSGPEKPWADDYPAGAFRDLYRGFLWPDGDIVGSHVSAEPG